VINYYLIVLVIIWTSPATKYAGGGICSVNFDGSAVYLTVKRFTEITEKIIPPAASPPQLRDRGKGFFHKYPLPCFATRREKSKDFNDFCLIAELMKNKAHLTEEGKNKIVK
jgi:hypothetical protein